ncbi:hypothetical protein [Pseudaquabacterium pictum]|uniref:Uncharacterized protein n=1 Tax=Pseudaquabacterium pictum TaxID=2315236 RepID=A0A480AX14_9BURK|nr:hypothetical protein [Rubrivivax pictus]GCL66024.1 hypothetical protein AQPW35_51050 [Rubrivivax pictus]
MPLHPLCTAALTSAALLLGSTALANTPVKPSAKPVAKPAAKPPTKAPARPAAGITRQQAGSTAKGLALATQTVEAISAGQLDVAARVLTGTADCEFNQRVVVQPMAAQAGYFTVSHQGKHYRMLPRETTTGAVRLEDPDNGIVWLQIPAKSMLMNARRGQRMVDGCMHAEQHAAVAAATAAGAAQGIGIVAPAPVAAPAASAASAPASEAAMPVAPVTPPADVAPPPTR